MQILNLVNKEASSINYNISHFPDGEVQITLDSFSRKDDVLVKCRITSAEELFILMQVMDILDRHEVTYSVIIYYLMGMRMDRVMDFNRPFTLKVVSTLLSKSKAHEIRILEPHSKRIFDLSNIFTEHIDDILEGFKTELLSCRQLVLPDAGAQKRYPNVSKAIFCSKVRDEQTGKLTGFEVKNPKDIQSKDLLILDDLCDGGGTFCGIAAELRKYKPDADINIFVTHMVNRKGIENLAKTFNKVYFTNSYRTWDNLPDNVIQIKIV